MQYSSALLETVITELTRLPGLGRKSAQRIAFHLLRSPEGDAKRLAQSIVDLKAKVEDCRICGNVTETQPCAICADSRRDNSVICVVEQPMDVLAIERTGEFRGSYHVLKGALSPIDGIGPEQLKLSELIDRVKPGGVVEVIVATNPTAQGEATALYIARLLQNVPGLRVTRIARGVPMGSDLEFSDQVTLARALSGRKEI
ncbi:MAG: recombination protein RecR [Candidatus Eisenbacteria bacterium]|uniref:Recombination protein RecR n=2 Tax=Eiseniibacteriota bacterium TaxID=2212470 RepID=A0A538TFH1_UNCEI|nr:MAG: recombination protein RecR [Candidatus Eisenbacteria bacterium]